MTRPTAGQTERMATKRRTLAATIAVLGAANVIVTIDFYGTNTALPSIIAELGIGTDTDQWISLAYLLALAAPLVAAGRFADLHGRRRVLMFGLAVLGGGQLVSAFAQHELILLAGRAVSGFGGALVTATGLALVSAAAAPAQRATAIGAWSAIGAVGAAVGPLLGGVVTEVLSWRWFFALAAPAAVLVGLAASALVPPSRDEHPPPSADVVGAVTSTAGLALLVFAGTSGAQDGWFQRNIVIGLVAGAGFMVWFALAERRAAAPLVPAEIVRNRLFVLAGAVAFLSNAAFATVMFFLTLYLQQVRNLGPTMTGVVFLALTVPLMALSPLLGRFVHRLGQAGVMATGMAVLVASFVVLGTLDATSGILLAIAGLALSGAGQAFAFNGSNEAALAEISDDDVGVASGAVNGIRQLGAVAGLAVTGALFDFLRRGEIEAGKGMAQSFTDALRPTMLFVAGICLLGAVLAAGARRRRRATRP